MLKREVIVSLFVVKVFVEMYNHTGYYIINYVPLANVLSSLMSKNYIL